MPPARALRLARWPAYACDAPLRGARSLRPRGASQKRSIAARLTAQETQVALLARDGLSPGGRRRALHERTHTVHHHLCKSSPRSTPTHTSSLPASCLSGFVRDLESLRPQVAERTGARVIRDWEKRRDAHETHKDIATIPRTEAENFPVPVTTTTRPEPNRASSSSSSGRCSSPARPMRLGQTARSIGPISVASISGVSPR